MDSPQKTFEQHQRDKQWYSFIRLTFGVCVAAYAVGAAGCFSPNHARFPIAQPSHPQSEAQAFQLQDPFPDPDIGPDIMSRPPDYLRPRTESRKAAEQRLFQGTPSGPEYMPPGYPRGGLSRPGAVN
jgi:hypothetical protein